MKPFLSTFFESRPTDDLLAACGTSTGTRAKENGDADYAAASGTQTSTAVREEADSDTPRSAASVGTSTMTKVKSESGDADVAPGMALWEAPVL
jgi:hypothetical protein